jgi:hypothetical protein
MICGIGLVPCAWFDFVVGLFAFKLKSRWCSDGGPLDLAPPPVVSGH